MHDDPSAIGRPLVVEPRDGLRPTLLLLTTALLACPATAAVPQLRAPAEVSELLTRFLNLDEVSDAVEEAALARRMQREVSGLLATEGYFSPHVVLREEEGQWLLEVDPGPRSRIGRVTIDFPEDLDADRREALRKAWKLKPGEPFRQSVWHDAKQSLLADLLAVDYAAARLRETRAEVDPEAQRVDLSIVADTGPRYRFGDIQIEGLQRYSPELIARLNRSVRPGDDYREDRLLAMQAALQNTPYFSSVSVTLEAELEPTVPPPAGERITAPVSVRVRERSPHQVSLSAGYGTNTGARAEATYRSSDLFNRAWELQTGVRVEQLRQTAYADVFFPPDEAQSRTGVGSTIENSDIEGLAIRRLALGALRVEQRGRVEQRLSVNWQEEQRSPVGAAASINRALTALIGWTWRQAVDPLDPAEGLSLQLQIGGGSKQLLSDQNFLRTYLRYSQGIPFGSSGALLLRGELGAVWAPSRTGIPQDSLFRAGGSQSVRGYAYQSLGVREGSAIVGGRYLATMSAEYTHWLTPSWGAAAFIDAGDAADERRALDAATGYGLGARWKSPVGPLGIDLAYGQRTGKLRFDFSLAIPF